MRTAIMVGAAFGVVAVLFVFLFNGTAPALLLEAILAVIAGAVAAYLSGRALLDAALTQVLPDTPAPPPGPVAPAAPRRRNAGDGATAGAIVGVIGGLAFTAVAFGAVAGGGSREQ
jgi:hypothetical protein